MILVRNSSRVLFEKRLYYLKEGFKLSKIEEVRTAMYAAMKAKDKERKDALSMLLGALKANGS